ncbi:hypothetical protein [Qipengyuania sp. JC766]|uniref:hypothetical protein n=1 Tax=Qipengyuania sp. JC766 TaxID=3232139 RepID=UPI00345B0FBA
MGWTKARAKTGGVLLCGLLALASCGDPDAEQAPEPRDPVLEQALNNQLMADPDLVNQNEANAALTIRTGHSLPPLARHPEAIQAARDEARRLLGGSDRIDELPEPLEGEELGELAWLTAGSALALQGAQDSCLDTLDYTAKWAAPVSRAVGLYPDGHVVEAAGSDAGSCKLRAVRYRTPVGLEDVLAFHYAWLRPGDNDVTVTKHGSEYSLEAATNDAKVTVQIRNRADGLTEAWVLERGA